MDWFPRLEWGILNGWTYLVFYLTIFVLTMRTCPKDVRKRLYDRSLWDKKTKIITAFGKCFSFVNLIMIIMAVLVIGTVEFIIGNILFLAGLTLLVVAIINYRDAPLDQPITNGLYKISRNPQMVGIYIMFAGMILVIGSWINLIFLGITITTSHFSILGEESSLEQQYGDSYLEFKKQVPRYFIFF